MMQKESERKRVREGSRIKRCKLKACFVFSGGFWLRASAASTLRKLKRRKINLR
jgi:hypothetical protein